MRFASGFAAWIGLLWIVNLAADEAFPYTARVLGDRCAVRSGPGDEHYVTDQLQRGDEVEVFERVGGGWLAIRPPASSFSWVAERDLEATAVGGVSSVVGQMAVSWIGSNVEDVRNHKWLVKLDEGETVTVLGRQRCQLLADGKTDVYCKISPPAGEFRWIHTDDLASAEEPLEVRDPEVALADFRVSLEGTPRTSPAPATPTPNPARLTTRPTASPGGRLGAASSAAPPATLTAPVGTSRKDDFMGRTSAMRSPAGGSLPTTDNRTARLEPRSLSAPPTLASMDLEKELRELDVNLSLAVAQPVEKWEFTSLRQSAERLATDASSTLARARVQIFLDKVRDFESLKSRHALLGRTGGSAPARLGAPVATPSGQAGNNPASKSDPRFDGTGWLLPVYSSNRPSPPYALLDKDGNVLQFVSPAPGLNLNRYLRKEIGVFGQKDTTNSHEQPHLTAQRVVELDRHRVQR